MKEYVIAGDDKKRHIVVVKVLDGEPIVLAMDEATYRLEDTIHKASDHYSK